jgi:hypothetical protein
MRIKCYVAARCSAVGALTLFKGVTVKPDFKNSVTAGPSVAISQPGYIKEKQFFC